MKLLCHLSFIILLLACHRPDPCTYNEIDHQPAFSYSCTGDLIINGRIDGQSNGSLLSTKGNVIIRGRIDGQSTVNIRAKGNVRIEGKIDGASNLRIFCEGDITIRDKIDGASICDLNTVSGTVRITRIGNPVTQVRYHSPAAIIMDGPNDVSPTGY
jgi:hypothetical protein